MSDNVYTVKQPTIADVTHPNPAWSPKGYQDGYEDGLKDGQQRDAEADEARADQCYLRGVVAERERELCRLTVGVSKYLSLGTDKHDIRSLYAFLDWYTK